ncbi:MAG: SDR family oxidoreductase [Verrucomicrobiales bacterium]|nr:SDR family oxidoreductase [Verrucomicrobiales bacterium]
MRLSGKSAIVTGAGSGIGNATVRKFLEEGASVFATDIDASALEDLASECPGVETVAGDVSRLEDGEAIVRAATDKWGKLDILVNSAGITARNVGDQASLEERWDKVMAVNVKGSMLMANAAVGAMRESGGGAIVNLSSVMGFTGYPTTLEFSDGFNPYPSSKGAVSQLTRDMGVRLAGEGIRVNAVAPGFVHTSLTANVTQNPEILKTLNELHPAGRMGTAEEVANVIAFLASDEASFVNGAVWMVDGGYSAQ